MNPDIFTLNLIDTNKIQNVSGHLWLRYESQLVKSIAPVFGS